MLGVGIDLGYEACGVGVMELSTNRIVDHATIHTARSEALSDRLQRVHQQLSLVISRKGVVVVGFESPLRVGKAKQTQGKTNYNPLILCIVSGYVQSLGWERGLPVYCHEPQDVKRAVLGKGGGAGSKADVRKAVLSITGLALNEHEADAVATVLRTARMWHLERRIKDAHA